jgi:hypothetical protein
MRGGADVGIGSCYCLRLRHKILALASSGPADGKQNNFPALTLQKLQVNDFACGTKSRRAVYIPKPQPSSTTRRGVHGTACFSSQFGSSLACSFCATGVQIIVRNLTARKIVSQHVGHCDVGALYAS